MNGFVWLRILGGKVFGKEECIFVGWVVEMVVYDLL